MAKDTKTNSSFDYQRELKFANAYACQLLMPKDKVQKTLLRMISEDNLNPDALSQDDVKDLISKTATKLGVSHNALDYRIKNLQLLITK